MATVWNVDLSHSAIHFTVRHMVVSKVRGRFSKFSGQIQFDPEKVEAGSVQVEIDPSSVDTNDAQRDGHLRSGDFFEIEKFPKAAFKSTRVSGNGEGKLRVEGELTLHGVTRPIVLDATFEGSAADPWGGTRAGFSATASLDRRDFGISFNKALDAGGVLVGDKIELNLEIEAIKQA
jgi:polyisoprenoid-binding protein YceI